MELSEEIKTIDRIMQAQAMYDVAELRFDPEIKERVKEYREAKNEYGALLDEYVAVMAILLERAMMVADTLPSHYTELLPESIKKDIIKLKADFEKFQNGQSEL